MKAKFWGLLALCFLAGRATAEDSKLFQTEAQKESLQAKITVKKTAILECLQCPECQAVMEAGVVPDQCERNVASQLWLSGNFPTNNYGNRSPRKYLNVSDQQMRDGRVIVTYRCINCGYLKSYAK